MQTLSVGNLTLSQALLPFKICLDIILPHVLQSKFYFISKQQTIIYPQCSRTKHVTSVHNKSIHRVNKSRVEDKSGSLQVAQKGYQAKI